MIEAIDRGTETGPVRIARPGRNRRQCPAMETAGEADHPVTFGIAVGAVILAHQFNRCLDRFRARIAEKHGFGEGIGDQAVRQAMLFRNIVQVGRVPDLTGLRDQRFDQMGMAMTERQHGNAGTEIEEFPAIAGIQIGPIAFLKGNVRAPVGRHYRLAHRSSPDIRSPILFGESNRPVTGPKKEAEYVEVDPRCQSAVFNGFRFPECALARASYLLSRNCERNRLIRRNRSSILARNTCGAP